MHRSARRNAGGAIVSDNPHFSEDDPIPLCEPSSTPVQIIHRTAKTPDADTDRPVRGKRQRPRRQIEKVEVCLSTHDASGRTDHIDCPLVDVSQDGVAVVCDRRVSVGTRCYVSYRTVSQQPVHVGGVVMNCARIESARYRIGLMLDRRLRNEEQKPAKCLPGRPVSPSHQGRKLRGSVAASDTAVSASSESHQPVVREPSLGDGPDDYDLTPE